MAHWELWQWSLFIAPNIITWAAYFYIPHRLKNKKTELSKEKNNFLFVAFIRACGLHHLTHPFFMYMHWFWPLVIECFMVAAISVVAAIMADFD